MEYVSFFVLSGSPAAKNNSNAGERQWLPFKARGEVFIFKLSQKCYLVL